MNFSSIIIGIITFLIIGIFHPIVIKSEYYFSKKIWPIFLILGIVFLGIALAIQNMILSCSMAIVGITCFWSIQELIEQEQRVKKGWFPANPNRK